MKSASYIVALIGLCSVVVGLAVFGLTAPLSTLFLTFWLVSTASLSTLLLAILHYDPPID